MDQDVYPNSIRSLIKSSHFEYNERLDEINFDLRNSGCALVFNYHPTVSKDLIYNTPKSNEQCGTVIRRRIFTL